MKTNGNKARVKKANRAVHQWQLNGVTIAGTKNVVRNVGNEKKRRTKLNK